MPDLVVVIAPASKMAVKAVFLGHVFVDITFSHVLPCFYHTYISNSAKSLSEVSSSAAGFEYSIPPEDIKSDISSIGF